MRNNKKDWEVHVLSLAKARKGESTRREALAVIARTSDYEVLAGLSCHPSPHVKHAAMYKINPEYRAVLAMVRAFSVAKVA